MNRFGRKAVKGFLHTQGTKLVNGDGEEIILEGYGVGNWVNPEGFMIGNRIEMPEDYEMGQAMGFLGGKPERKRLMPPDRFDRHRTVTAVVRELCGEEYLKTFWPRWYRNHLSEEDIKAMAELDLNSVRLVLNAATLLKEEPGIHFDEEGFRTLEQAIDWCEKYNIYAILDLHAAPGGQAGCPFDNGYDSMPRLFYDRECWERGVLLWEEIAKRFGDRWIVGGYDLLNEPLSLPVDREQIPKLGEFYDACIAAIRKHDKKHMFALEPAGFSRYNITFDHDFDPECHNWCIHWHRYDFSPELNEITPYLLKGREYNVPVWIGEGGSSPEANAVFFNIVQEYGVGYCLWCWKTAAEEGLSRVAGHKLPAEWGLITEYCRGGSKPPYEKAKAIFDEYLENMKYENCEKDFSAINRSRRIAPFELPAVGYDHSETNGESFSGSWGQGNLLNYRAADHTKLVWDDRYPEPLLWLDGANERLDPVPDNRNPLTRLLLELSVGEFAVYTVRKTQPGSRLILEAKSPEGAAVAVSVDGEPLGEIAVPAGKEPAPCADQIPLPLCEFSKIRLTVTEGTAQLARLRFTAGE